MKNYTVLYIYLLFHLVSHGQQLQWNLEPQLNEDVATIDSIYTPQKTFNYIQLKQLKDSVINIIKRSGYYALLEQPLERINDTVFLTTVSLGKKYSHVELIASAGDFVSKEMLEIMLSRKRNKNIIPASQLTKKLKALKDYLNNNGYSMAKVTPVAFEFNRSDTVRLKIGVNAGTLRTIDRLEIKGYPEFPKTFLKSILGKNKKASQKNIEDINDKLNQLTFSKVTKEPELLFKKDSTILYSYLERKNSNQVDGMIGFNSNPEGSIELNGYLDLLLQNNLNTGESIHLIYRGDNEDQTRLNLNLKLPYILRTKLGIQSSLEILRRDSTYQNTEIEAGLFFLANHQTELGLNYSSLSSTTSTSNTNSVDFSFNGITLQITHEKRNSDPLQFEDMSLSTSIQFGSRNTTSSSDQQLRIESELIKRFKITNNQSFLTSGRLKYLNTNNLFFNELYQIGGLNSIRGFNQNAIDTSFFTSINTEYRYQLSPGIYLHSILDVGYFESFTTEKLENIYSFGIGTGILTNAGLLKLSIANGVFNSANIDFSSTIAHINLLIRF